MAWTGAPRGGAGGWAEGAEVEVSLIIRNNTKPYEVLYIETIQMPASSSLTNKSLIERSFVQLSLCFFHRF